MGYALLTISWSPETAETGLVMATTKGISLLLTVLIAALILAPWLTVRKVQVQARVQSPAIIEITFPGGSELGMFGRISRHALADWHAFAIVSGERKAVSHMMVISAVGHFTKGLITKAPTVDNYRSFGADAVFVGSNPEGTRQIVSGCRALGIPAFGPSWDS